MKSFAKQIGMHLLMLLVFAVSAALTWQHSALAQSSRIFNQEELDQMLAPIALYPDPLLSQILMASTYPIEVGEAARWSKANPNLKGDEAVKAVEKKNWDPSVQSLVAFPQILTMMDEKLDWTERLGDAFLGQQAQVMDTIQYLRKRAQEAGNLNSNPQMTVVPQGDVIAIEPANPQLFYVPYYDPAVVYGSWWWPAYPPVYWAPWPDYYFTNYFAWGAGIIIGTQFFFGAFDWPHRHVNVTHFDRMRAHRRPSAGAPPAPLDAWRHDTQHRLGVPYREQILRRQTAPGNVLPESRRGFRGHEPAPAEVRVMPQAATPQPAPPQPRATVQEVRPSVASPSVVSPGVAPPPRQFQPSVIQAQPAAPDAISRPPSGRPHVFEGVGQGPEVRDFSRRGRASSQTMEPGPQITAPAVGRTREFRQPGSVAAPQTSGGSTETQSSGDREHGRRRMPGTNK